MEWQTAKCTKLTTTHPRHPKRNGQPNNLCSHQPVSVEVAQQQKQHNSPKKKTPPIHTAIPTLWDGSSCLAKHGVPSSCKLLRGWDRPCLIVYVVEEPPHELHTPCRNEKEPRDGDNPPHPDRCETKPTGNWYSRYGYLPLLRAPIVRKFGSLRWVPTAAIIRNMRSRSFHHFHSSFSMHYTSRVTVSVFCITSHPPTIISQPPTIRPSPP